jgi:hypothetical protein
MAPRSNWKGYLKHSLEKALEEGGRGPIPKALKSGACVYLLSR